MATFYEAFKLKNRIWRMMLQRPGVTGIGIGFANRNKPSKGAAIVLYTYKNLTSAIISSLHSSLKKIASMSSVPVRIIAAGEFIQNGAAPTQARPRGPRDKWHPIPGVPGGVSIGSTTPVGITGTGGLIVIKEVNGVLRLFILSNAHVLANANTPQFYNTIQPGTRDGGSAGDRIGRTFQYVPLNPYDPINQRVNFVDAAIAIADSNDLLNPRYLADTNGNLLVVPGHLRSYPVGATFKRMSRTNELSRGVVEAIGEDHVIRSRIGGTPVVLIYRNVTVIRHTQGKSGLFDSGSVWLNQSNDIFNNNAAAVHFAGIGADGSRSLSYPIDIAMRAFGTLVAVPAAGGRFKAGVVRGNPPKNDFSYVRPLTREQIARIPVVRAKSRLRGKK